MRVKIRKNRLTMGQFVFFVALFLTIVISLIDSSLYTQLLPSGFVKRMYILVIVLLVVKLVVQNRYPGKLLICILSFLVVAIVIAIVSDYTVLMVDAALIVSAYDVEFDKILKCMGVAMLLAVLFVVFSCKLGIIEDYTYDHGIGALIDTAHSWGFKYYSTISYIVMTLTAIFLYFCRKLGYAALAILAAINVALFFAHTTRLSIVVGLLMIVVYIFTVRNRWLKFKARFWGVVGVALPPFFCLFTLIMVILYGNDGFEIELPIFNTIAARLNYSVQAMDEYGIKWLGSKVVMYGNTALYYGDSDSGFYIDSGYMYMMIAYGILFSVLMIVLYMLVAHYVHGLNDPYLFVWMIVVLGICCINNFVLSVSCNPFIYMIPMAIRYFWAEHGVRYSFKRVES